MSDQTVKIPGALRPHVSLDVANVETSIPFYAALFGVAPKKIRADYAKFELEAPALNFSINEKVTDGARVQGSLNHLGFEVATTADVLEAKTRLEASGLVAFDEMDVTCCYAKQDKIWVHDPDGNAWEIFVVTEANVDMRDTSTSSANCCVPTARATISIPGFAVVAQEACC